jgi:uncharacterized protein (DUF58 family)
VKTLSNEPSKTSPPQTEPAPVGAGRAWLLELYAKSYFSSLRLSRKLLPTGKAMLCLVAASFLMVWDPSKQSMRYAFGVPLAAFLVAWILNFVRAPRRLRLTRRLPETATEGSLFDYVIVATNHGRLRTPPLHCRDHAVMRFPTSRDWARKTPPFDASLGRFDRWLGYPKWMWLVEVGQDAIGSDVEIPPLAPGQSVEIPAIARAGRPGPRVFVGFYCSLSDPMGLLARLFHVPARQSYLSLPRPLPCGLDMPSGSRGAGPGDARDLARSGDSEEFRSLRDWRPGDPLKRIDWKATARSLGPIAREYAPEFRRRCALAFDATLPEGVDEEAFEDAMAVAAGVALGLDRKESSIDLLILAERVVSIPMGRGSSDPAAALGALAASQPRRSESLDALEAAILSAGSGFSSVLLACAAWTPEHAKLAQSIVAQGLGLAVAVSSEPQADFPPGVAWRVVRRESACRT